jgi:hypothetical protein
LARLLPIVVVLALLGGTAAAFAVTEGLKLEKTPISATRVDKTFSPVCRCPRRLARIAFRLRKAESVTVQIVEGRDHVVRTLVAGRLVNHGFHTFYWNGREDDGRIAPDGDYQPRVHLSRERRTILLPNVIALDTRPPTIHVVSARVSSRPSSLSLIVRYRVNEPARGLLYVDGRRRVLTHRVRLANEFTWVAAVPRRGYFARVYSFSIGARDLAGNVAQQPLSVPSWTTAVAELKARKLAELKRLAAQRAQKKRQKAPKRTGP